MQFLLKTGATMVSNKRRYVRGRRGATTIAEAGPTLFLVFIIFAFPLMAFATIGFRYTFLLYAARIAASAASRCGTWSTDISPTKLSAVTTANNIARGALAAQSLTGVTVTNVTTKIWVCPANGAGAPTLVAGPIAAQTGYIYNIEVTVFANVAPLVTNGKNWFVNCIGLTEPIATSARADAVFENSSGTSN